MTLSSTEQRQHWGAVLVVLQFGLLAVLAGLAWQGVALGSGRWTMVRLLVLVLLLLLSVVLVAWTLAHNRLGNFRIHPAPKAEGQLITSGPYRLIRHPMYTAVWLGGAALALAAGPDWVWWLWAALVGVLWVKANLEEAWLLDHYPLYRAYCRTSKRFIPWLV